MASWLACGKLHVLAGPAGTGKTTIAIHLAATVTTGGAWPDGTRCQRPGHVLIWSAEDGVADTLIPRLRAAGADLNKVIFVTRTNLDGESRSFDPAFDIPLLAAECSKLVDVRVLIIDPVVSAVAANSHNNAETRRSLQPLVDFAEHLGAAVIGITHFTKGTKGREPLERVTGSLAFGALARIILGAMKGDDEQRLLVRVKSNIGPDGGDFGYALEYPDMGGGIKCQPNWVAPFDDVGILGGNEPGHGDHPAPLVEQLSAAIRASIQRTGITTSVAECAAYLADWPADDIAEITINPACWTRCCLACARVRHHDGQALCRRHCRHVPIDFVAEVPPGDGKIVVRLEVQPEFRGGAEVPGQTQRSIRRDGAITVGDAGNSVRRHVQRLGQRVCSQTEFVEKLGLEDFAGMDRCAHGVSPSVIVRDFDLIGIATAPCKADPELLVNPDAELPGTVAVELLKAISRRRAQIAQVSGGMQHQKLPVGSFQQGTRHNVRATAVEYRPRTVASPRLDCHRPAICAAYIDTSSVNNSINTV